MSGILAVKFYDKAKIMPLRFSVVAAQLDGEWLFVRHREREGWEFPGGHIEQGETPLSAAKREIYEEAGVVEAEFHHVANYGVTVEGGEESCGALFVATKLKLADIPDFEMAERKFSAELPEKLVYPEIIVKLRERAMEYMDINLH